MNNAAERIERLAGSPIVAPRSKRRLKDQLRDLRRAIDAAYQRLSSLPQAAVDAAPGAEWLLDNHHLIRRAARILQKGFPAGFERRLPCVRDGEWAGYPRAYALAREMALALNLQIQFPAAADLVTAFQAVAHLTIAELWALPTLLRLTFLEHLASAAQFIVQPIDPSQLETTEGGERPAGVQDPGQVVARCVRSLQTLETTDWKAFFEHLNTVERILLTDPAAVYPRMDFETRDRYRKVVEALALRSPCSEEAVATAAVRLSAAGQTERTRHVGYYIADTGRAALETEIAYRPDWRTRGKRLLTRMPTLTYLGSIVLVTVLAEGGLAAALTAYGARLPSCLVGLALALIPATTVAVNLVNGTVTRLMHPGVLPKMNFKDGIPADCRTLVVVPALLTDTAEIDTLCDALEIRFLANRDAQLQFALLTDFLDSSSETLPADSVLLTHTTERITRLNNRYGGDGQGPFHWLHRPRRWNACSGCWMGWERKRGKLSDLNRFLLSGQSQSFSTYLGDRSALAFIRYVVALDADTELPRDSARSLVATLAHPLNRAEFDPQSNELIAGYTVLQPRVEISPLSADESVFAQTLSGDVGLDPYTHAVSDVYQDLFGEGVYVGKGIYDVAAFERSLHDRVPQNALLSHDLFEGIHGRAGLVSDVVLIEDYPAHYLAYTRRLHRWARGDWQLLPWLGRRVPLAGGGEGPNRLSVIDRWRIVDNLRRSALPAALVAFLLVAWIAFPGPALVWTLLAIFVLATSGLADLTGRLVATAWSDARGIDIRRLGHTAGALLRLWLMETTFLVHQAAVLVDAISRTLVRLYVTHRHLLEWTPAAHAARRLARAESRWFVWREMAVAPVVAGASIVLVGWLHPAALSIALPVAWLWFMSPEIAWRVSRPRRRPSPTIAAAERAALRRLARRTWSFFETFVTPEDQWLPPDHFQEEPRGVVARRTSPTNIGLLLLSTVSAYDFGYLGLLWALLRMQNTFDTLGRMERFHGHFLNWYETAHLAPMPPRYVSTVDSGNLAGALLSVKQTCCEVEAQAVVDTKAWDGLLDTLAVLREAVDKAAAHTPASLRHRVYDQLDHMEQLIASSRDQPARWSETLNELDATGAPALDRLVLALFEGLSEVDHSLLAELRSWSASIHRHVERMRREMELFLSWLPVVHQAPPAVQAAKDPRLATAWAVIRTELSDIPAVRDLARQCAAAQQGLTQLNSALANAPLSASDRTTVEAWSGALGTALNATSQTAGYLRERLADVRGRAESFFEQMDFSLLYDEQRRLLRIGYDVTASRMDEHHYDLLASEARLASFVAIAKGDVPQEHWFHLGRPFGAAEGERLLLSWSGTMFEYLMPGLLLREEPDTLLGRTCAAAIAEQVRYGQRRGVPWGVSESGYYRFDAQQNYQYRAFGVPALGFKRGLEDDLVVAPYACVLALRYVPGAVVANLHRLAQLGLDGRHGLYEAIDFTKARAPAGAQHAIVRSFMAHHQGMILAAIDNFLHSDPLIRRFHTDPATKTVELLLFERPVLHAPVEQTRPSALSVQSQRRHLAMEAWEPAAGSTSPQAHVIANGRYTLVMTDSGGGFSRWGRIALTPWSADPTLDDPGMQLCIRDQATGRTRWLSRSAQSPPGTRRTVFHPHLVELYAEDESLSTQTRVTVVADADVEIRQLTLINRGKRRRSVIVGSYAEVVLDDLNAYRRHPAFSKLFVECEYLRSQHALVFHRRPRSPDESPAYLVHVLVLPSPGAHPTGFEMERGAFLGRGKSRSAASALWRNRDQPRDTKAVATLDPIMALAADIHLLPGRPRQMAFVTAIAESREAAIELALRFRSLGDVDWAFDRARSAAESELLGLEIDSHELPTLQRILSRLLYPQAARTDSGTSSGPNELGHSSLWRFVLSGDLPILLLRMQLAETPLLHQLIRAQTWWRQRGLLVDLVVLNEAASGYSAETDDRIVRAVATAGAEARLQRPGGVFVVRADQLSDRERTLLFNAARVILDGNGPPLKEQLDLVPSEPAALPVLPTSSTQTHPIRRLTRPADLRLDNGFGGFSADGRQYVIHLEPGQHTPAPWVNVVANPQCGFIVSESGSSCTWAGNSGENRLTPWYNDPVSDPAAETVYLRDEETGEVWSPTPAPAPAPAAYQVRHAAGLTTFLHDSHGIEQQLRCFVAPEDPIKLVQLQLANHSLHQRRLTVTYFAEWVLGTTRDPHQQFINLEFDADTQALLARNPWNEAFGTAVAFAAASRRLHGFTTDRTEFLGRCGDRARPAALDRIGLANAVRAGLDPCAALQVHLDLAAGETQTLHFLLGQGKDRPHALQLVCAYRDAARPALVLDAIEKLWDQLLGVISVRTPEPAFDLMVNRWLLYQVLTSRFWGRSAFYQSSGAFGFRDQLQDVAALLYGAPEISRAHILAAAAHQFVEGDVLHWWHPPADTGVRTRCSDDLLWLPFVTARYVEVTDDVSVLREVVPFLDGDPLRADELERYGRYAAGTRNGTVYEHCIRAIERAHTIGRHGLPLFGTGDWNDGMNRVGRHGRGESVWLGWFLYATLVRFAPLCRRMADARQADDLLRRAENIRHALAATAWDGSWYRRGYYDDGSPLGSSSRDECRIDSVAQSWAVLSGAADPERMRLALHTVRQHLIRPSDNLIRLLAPPFDHSSQDPGYIRGYPPGIRENGGQYTHAAIWVVWALAQLGEADVATRLFLDLLPTARAGTRDAAERYRVEPYTLAADIYTVAPHLGKGGWTWYTGSAAWAYRFGCEVVLGLHREGDMWVINPCIPPSWSTFEVTLRDGATTYAIDLHNPDHVSRGLVRVIFDGQERADYRLPRTDGGVHHVEITLGGPQTQISDPLAQVAS